jgi:hypothetical protein
MASTLEEQTGENEEFHLFVYYQTPTPGETWELTLLSRGNKDKNNKNKNNNPHLNSPRRDSASMQPSVTKGKRLHS